MRPSVHASALAVLALLVACGDGGASLTPDSSLAPDRGGVQAGRVTVAPSAEGVVLGNDTGRPAGYAVYGQQWVAAALWGPCTEPTGCPTLAPGERRTIRAADIPGIDAARRDVVVYWWHLVAAREGGLRPDSVRSTVARVGG